MLCLNINSDPGATSKQKSFANDTLRNDFSPGVTDRGGSSSPQKKIQRCKEQFLSVTIGASAKAQTNRYLSAGSYGTTSGARTIPPSKKHADLKQEKSSTGSKAPAQHKSALTPERPFLKGKGKEAAKPKKQARFETDNGSESD
jgi:hypothetical protein